MEIRFRGEKGMGTNARAIVALCTVGLLFAGCLHVGREVDLVSKLGLEKTERIVVGVEGYGYYDPAAYDISDKDMIARILSNFRHAKGVRSAKYETIGWVTFFAGGGWQVELVLYGSGSDGIAKVGRRFYIFDGELLEMIRSYIKEKQRANVRDEARLAGDRGTESAEVRLPNDGERARSLPIVQRGVGCSGEQT